jgi:antibiotic biosynthesis monooxygenase (ABM) superfamily enzyme
MYGTVMIGKLKPGKQADWRKDLEDWKAERKVPGFVNEYTLIGDDGVTLASCVVFESKEAYMALANDPEQDRWWQNRVVPLLDGGVRWIDGNWAG